jgi:hypothetical protein
VGKQLVRCFTCGKYGGEEEGKQGNEARCAGTQSSNLLSKSERRATEDDERLRRLEDKAYDDFNEYEEDCGG